MESIVWAAIILGLCYLAGSWRWLAFEERQAELEREMEVQENAKDRAAKLQALQRGHLHVVPITGREEPRPPMAESASVSD